MALRSKYYVFCLSASVSSYPTSMRPRKKHPALLRPFLAGCCPRRQPGCLATILIRFAPLARNPAASATQVLVAAAASCLVLSRTNQPWISELLRAHRANATT